MEQEIKTAEQIFDLYLPNNGKPYQFDWVIEAMKAYHNQFVSTPPTNNKVQCQDCRDVHFMSERNVDKHGKSNCSNCGHCIYEVVSTPPEQKEQGGKWIKAKDNMPTDVNKNYICRWIDDPDRKFISKLRKSSRIELYYFTSITGSDHADIEWLYDIVSGLQNYKIQQLESIAFTEIMKDVWNASREGTHNDGTMLPFGHGYKYKSFTDYKPDHPTRTAAYWQKVFEDNAEHFGFINKKLMQMDKFIETMLNL